MPHFLIPFVFHLGRRWKIVCTIGFKPYSYLKGQQTQMSEEKINLVETFSITGRVCILGANNENYFPFFIWNIILCWNVGYYSLFQIRRAWRHNFEWVNNFSVMGKGKGKNWPCATHKWQTRCCSLNRSPSHILLYMGDKKCDERVSFVIYRATKRKIWT